MTIKELPAQETPRNKFIKYGVENLSDSDLISIILGSGTKGFSVKEISNTILKNLNNINDLKNMNIIELSKLKGVGKIKAITLLSSVQLGRRVYNQEIVPHMKLNNSNLINKVFKNIFYNEKQEKLLVIFLDSQKCLINYKILFIGTIDKSLIHPREVFVSAIKNYASSIVLMHNHPSGNINPSNYDIEITKKMIEVGDIIGIQVIDHIITNGEEYYSFYDEDTKK